MKRDKYGRFISNKTEGIEKGKPKHDAKGRFLPKENKAIENTKQKTEPDCPQVFNELPEVVIPELPTNIKLPEIPEIPTISELPKINPPKYTIDDIRKAFIAGLNDSQGILPLSKRFEMYCKKSGINL